MIPWEACKRNCKVCLAFKNRRAYEMSLRLFVNIVTMVYGT